MVWLWTSWQSIPRSGSLVIHHQSWTIENQECPTGLKRSQTYSTAVLCAASDQVQLTLPRRYFTLLSSSLDTSYPKCRWLPVAYGENELVKKLDFQNSSVFPFPFNIFVLAISTFYRDAPLTPRSHICGVDLSPDSENS